MARIQNHFERRFRLLLVRLGIEDVGASVQKLFSLADKLSEEMPRSLALARIHVRLSQQASPTEQLPAHFLCDAGLGGLARWLRAAGYDAVWQPELDDAGVIREAQRLGATLITTDTLMMERGVLRDGLVPSIWVPPTVTPDEQLALVFGEMRLQLRPSRCMKCGGQLRKVKKEDVADQIPPKTYRWRDEYFVCTRCDQLFWLGTHWNKIRGTLERMSSMEQVRIDLPFV